MTSQHFDILVVSPLELELARFFEVFPSIADLSTDTRLIHQVDSGNPAYSMLVVHQEEIGRASAQLASQYCLGKYSFGLIVCLGIAGGLSKDLKLGDVCYSRILIDVYENAKVSDSSKGGTDLELAPITYRVASDIISAMNFVRTQPAYYPSYVNWQNQREAVAEQLLPTEVSGREGRKDLIRKPSSQSGTLICGNVSKSEAYNKKLRSIDRSAFAIETETGGIFLAARDQGTSVISIRAIADYADGAKTTLETETKGKARELAAGNAATFLRLQLDNSHFLKALNKRRGNETPQLPGLELQGIDAKLAKLLTSTEECIDENLRRLSPEYKLHSKGFRLPVPRIRPIKADSHETNIRRVDKISIKDALAVESKLLITLPRSYPDQSLPWVLADDLLTSMLGEKQIVPIVIDGHSIRGKNDTLVKCSQVDIQDLTDADGIQYVVIIDNLVLSSSHRVGLVTDLVKSNPNFKFIFLSRVETNILQESGLAAATGAESYDLCPIAFRDIANFIQKNFDMPSTEAQVIAKNLRDTFEKFDLDAHPTYFAGIPKETLSALLQANKRSELIQLAVDGFLTFLVAGDKDNIALSRTTRAKFLRKLVVEICVEKRSFEQDTLVTFTRDFARLFDFDINPLLFINAFIEQGILHFDNDKIKFSLPFIESYLLASELSLDKDLADKYFDLSDQNFDLATFDLYAEIGASEQIISRIQEAIGTVSDSLGYSNGEHILVGESISPINLRHPERMEILKNRLAKAADDVRQGMDNVDEKQELIDLGDRIRTEGGKQLENTVGKEVTEDKFIRPLESALQIWTVATVLIGSGAEHLDAATKRLLAGSIVDVGAAIIDKWTKLQRSIDFKDLKEKLLRDDVIDSLPGGDDQKRKKETVSALIDILEFAALGDPLRKVLGFLCEQARNRVLATSVENAQVTGNMEKLLHSVWLMDLDSQKGKKFLNETLRGFPSATFLRLTTVAHLMHRVYWSHWKTDERLTILDSAEKLLVASTFSIKKSEITRKIKILKSDGDDD